MSKDKSKKSTSDEFGKPSEAPAGGDGFKLTEGAKDRLILFTPLRVDKHAAFDKKRAALGETDEHIVADIVVLNEKHPEKSEEHENVWVFPAYVQGSLRGFIDDRKVLGRLRHTDDTTKAKSSFGKGYWELEDADEDEVGIARAYLTALNDPFRSKKKADGGKKSKAEATAEPEKKSKKKK